MLTHHEVEDEARVGRDGFKQDVVFAVVALVTQRVQLLVVAPPCGE